MVMKDFVVFLHWSLLYIIYEWDIIFKRHLLTKYVLHRSTSSFWMLWSCNTICNGLLISCLIYASPFQATYAPFLEEDFDVQSHTSQMVQGVVIAEQLNKLTLGMWF